MGFHEVLEGCISILRRQGRVSYRALKREFGIDDAYLDDLKAELTQTLKLAHDEGGAMLVWNAAPSAAAAAPPAHAGPERRQLTIMFCDVADATELSQRLDAEDLLAAVSAYQQVVGEVVERMGGHVAQYLGDGVLVYFGYPQAHEDDARRAVASALEIVAGLAPLRARFAEHHRQRFAVRIGVHTGAVVVAEMGGAARHEQLALGDTPNIAARVQALAAPDGVLVSGPTWRLVQGYFIGQPVGERALKGIAQPMQLVRVSAESGAEGRLDTTREGLTPLIGRDSETKFLLERWAACRAGRGQVVMLGGEAGIGKSRLLELLLERTQRDGGTAIVLRCSPYHANSALHPVLQQLRKQFSIERNDSPEAARAKLAQALAADDAPADTVLPLFAWLLSLPLPEPWQAALAPLNAQQRRQQAQAALVGWLVGRAQRRPLLVACEDLHWADPTTLEFLALLIDSVGATPALVLMTSRPEFSAPWLSRSGIARLTLDRLSEAQSQAMVSEVVHLSGLPPELVRQVVEKTDGVPLFIEELLKMILESGMLREEPGRYVLSGPLPALAIPATLQDSLMARLDRLAAAREVAQIGAAIGREFTREMVRAVATLDDAALERALAQLVDGEIIFRRGDASRRVGYMFKHALIRDAAYQSMLTSKRHLVHHRIADVLSEHFAELVAAEPELLAHHSAEAGQHAQAIELWQRAAQRAIERSANNEGIAHLKRALDTAALLPEGEARAQRELELCVALGVPLIASRGYADPQVERTYARARTLALEVAHTPQLPNIVWGLWVFYLCGGPLDAALAMAEQYRDLARAEPGDSALELEACQLMGISHFYRGEFRAALPYLQRGSTLYDPALHHKLVFAHGGADTGVAIMTHEALTRWALGDEVRARDCMARATRSAHTLAHPFSLAFALYYEGWLHKLCLDDGAARRAAGAAHALCEQHGFPFWGLTSAVLEGSTVPAGAACEDMQASLDAYGAIGGALQLATMRALLATARAARGQTQTALALVEQAIASLSARGERWYEAELHRLHGELLRAGGQAGDHARASLSLHNALRIAREQGCEAWAQRAARSLANHEEQTP